MTLHFEQQLIVNVLRHDCTSEQIENNCKGEYHHRIFVILLNKNHKKVSFFLNFLRGINEELSKTKKLFSWFFKSESLSF
jgi:Na+-transporting NADH:ubiquinone oxidoreductase subunit NqrA